MTGTWASGWATSDIVTAAEYKKQAGAIYDTTLGVATASIDVTSISATYAHLMVSIYARGDTASTASTVLMRFNGDTAANYDWQQVLGFATTVTAGEHFADTSVTVGSCAAASAGANLFSTCEVFIPHYAGSSNNKSFVSVNAHKIGTSTTNINLNFMGGGWRSNAAINQITFLPAAGNFAAGTRVTIHALGA